MFVFNFWVHMPYVINSTAVIKCPEQTEHAINATNRASLIAQEISSSTLGNVETWGWTNISF